MTSMSQGDAQQNDGKLRTLSPGVLRLRLRLTPERWHLVDGADRPSAIVSRLRIFALVEEQVAFLSYALPEREAVWWAIMCVLHTKPELPPEQQQALASSEDWVRQPSEEKRRSCRLAAKAAGGVSPAAFVARAVSASRLSVAESTHAGRMVEGALRRAATSDQPARTMQRLRDFIASGLDIAAGGAGRLPPEAAR